MMALKSVVCLNERHPNFEQTHVAKMRLFQSWFQEEHKIAESLLPLVKKELKKLGLPNAEGDLVKLNEAYMTGNAKSLAHLLQYLKVKAKVLKQPLAGADVKTAVKVLQADAKKQYNIQIAEKIYKRLPSADDFKNACSKEFKYATAFQDISEEETAESKL